MHRREVVPQESDVREAAEDMLTSSMNLLNHVQGQSELVRQGAHVLTFRREGDTAKAT